MLVAFLYDLLLRFESRGQSKLSDRYADLFRNYASKTVDANAAIMSLLGVSTATRSLLKPYVEERQPLELSQTLQQYGLLLQTEGGLTDLKIANQLTTDQLRLLKSLRYRR
jgi:predicted metalloprotease with PDZ domain